MKVSHLTEGNSSRARRRPAEWYLRRLTVTAFGLLLACHHGVKLPGPALAALPIESIALRVSLPDREARQLIRTILFQNGYQIHAEDRNAGWMRTNLGGLWEDRYRYRQWHIVVTCAHDPADNVTIVVMRALEVSTLYAAGVAFNKSALETTNGFTRVVAVTDVTPGEARQAWVQMERLALTIADRGAELLTDLLARR